VEGPRIAGWRHQQRSTGFAHGDELLAVAEQSEAGGDSAASLLLSERGRPWALHGRRPSALFVTSDAQAIRAIYACHELGLRIPEDVAIVSFGGTQPAAYTIPPLTTLRQGIDYLAAATVTHLCATIANPQTPQVDVTVRGNLVKAPVADAPFRTMPERATPRRRGPVVNRLASPSRPTTLKRNYRATNPRTSDHPSKDQARNGPVLAPQVRHKSPHDADAHRG